MTATERQGGGTATLTAKCLGCGKPLTIVVAADATFRRDDAVCFGCVAAVRLPKEREVA